MNKRGKQPSNNLIGATKLGLEKIMRGPDKEGNLTEEEIKKELIRFSAITAGRAIKAAQPPAAEMTHINVIEETALTKEQANLLITFEKDHQDFNAVFEKYEMSTANVPSWNRVILGLTPDVLEKARNLAEPTLLLIPPTTRHEKVKAFNRHPHSKDQVDAYAHDFGNYHLWNGGKHSEASDTGKWRVVIVDGAVEVEPDKWIMESARDNYEMIKLLVDKYRKLGLRVMNDADAFIMLVMKKLAEGKTVDTESCTVLNGENVTENESFIAIAGWDYDSLEFNITNPDIYSDDICLRGLLEVDVSDNALD